MEIKQLYPYWDIFLDLISETDLERKYLLQILHKQNKKIIDNNKEIISSIAVSMQTEKEKTITAQVILQNMRNNNNLIESKELIDIKEPSLVQRIMNAGRFFGAKNPEPDAQLTKAPTNQKKKVKKVVNIKPKKIKFITNLDEKGKFTKNNNDMGNNFFDDLNYGDIAIQFFNEEAQIKGNLKREYLTFDQAFLIYQNNINLLSEVQELNREYLQNEKKAFFNALWFFSTDFYAKEEFEPDEHKTPFSARIVDWNIITEEDYNAIIREKNTYKQTMLIEYLKMVLVEAKNEISEDLERQFLEKIAEEEKKYNQINEEAYNFTNRIFNVKNKIKNNIVSEQLKSTLRALCLPLKRKDDATMTCTILRPHFNMLVRKILIVKFNQMGLWTRTFVSSSLKFIFLVVKAQDTTILDRAEVDKMPKQFELGYVDVISFDPLDSCNRPFRIKQTGFTEYERKKTKLEANVFDNYQANAKTVFENLKVKGGEPKGLARIIRNINDYSLFDFYNLIEIRNSEFNLVYDRVVTKTLNELAFSRIIDDKVEDRSSWTPYLLYTLLFEYYMKGIKKLARFDTFKQYEGLIYRLIAMKSLRDTNEAFDQYRGFWSKKFHVKTLWNKFGMHDFISPWALFANNKHYVSYWRQYETNELGSRSVFLQMERIKLIFGFIDKAINIDQLLSLGTFKQYFPLHDYFMLFNDFKLPLFINIIDVEKVIAQKEGYQLRDIKKFLEIMKDEADESDFLEQPLREDVRFHFFKPWKISISTIRDYFGEKIAIYFRFLSFSSYHQFFMAIIGIVIFIIQDVFKDHPSRNAAGSYTANNFKIVTLIYIIILLLWTIVFTERWKRSQALFAMRYGMMDLDLSDKDNVRPGFVGENIRDLSSNDMNILYYSKKRRFLTCLYTYSVSVLIILSSIVVTVALLYWKHTNGRNDFGFFILLTLINTLQIIVFNYIYTRLAIIFTNQENHPTNQEYVDSLIFKLFTFAFFNTFNSMFIIAFIKPYYPNLFGSCIEASNFCDENNTRCQNGFNCFVELSFQVRYVFIINVIVALLVKILQPLITRIIIKYFNVRQRLKEYPWELIDRQIEHEAEKPQYALTQQVDNTIYDIQALMLNYTFLTLFSLTFPLAFLFSFISTVLNIIADKHKLMSFFQRPRPMNARSLGIWQAVLEIVIFLTIIVNSAIYVFTLNGNFENSGMSDLAFFLMLVLIFGTVKFIAQLAIADVPSNFQMIAYRHNYIEKKVLSGKTSGANAVARAGVFLNLGQIADEFINVEGK